MVIEDVVIDVVIDNTNRPTCLHRYHHCHRHRLHLESCGRNSTLERKDDDMNGDAN